MSESKELLEATIKGLEEKVNELNNDLNAKKKELADVNKPEMTEEMYGKLESCIIEGIQDTLGNLTQDDCDVEFGMEYDGKVYLESIDVQEDGFIEHVMCQINNKFKIK
jgi:hypothetical protein